MGMVQNWEDKELGKCSIERYRSWATEKLRR